MSTPFSPEERQEAAAEYLHLRFPSLAGECTVGERLRLIKQASKPGYGVDSDLHVTTLCELNRARKGLAEVRELLEGLQWGSIGRKRCPLCAGWNMSPNGETDERHTKTCPVGAWLAAHPADGPREG